MGTGSSVIHNACSVPGVASENCGSGARNWPDGSPSGGSHVIVQVSSTARLWGRAGFFHTQRTHILCYLPGSPSDWSESQGTDGQARALEHAGGDDLPAR